jgi:hypothetical protein
MATTHPTGCRSAAGAFPDSHLARPAVAELPEPPPRLGRMIGPGIVAASVAIRVRGVLVVALVWSFALFGVLSVLTVQDQISSR